MFFTFAGQESGSDDSFMGIIRSVLLKLEQEGYMCQKSNAKELNYLVGTF